MTYLHNDIACRTIHDAGAAQVKRSTTSFGVSVPQATFRDSACVRRHRGTKLRQQGKMQMTALHPIRKACPACGKPMAAVPGDVAEGRQRYVCTNCDDGTRCTIR